ncbi:hypothetical protein EVAR_46268_1 [Eumeta japonica]|uniref:Chitin-binding type-2 domain-containing protein n=1 Tax=Eumeta variegata TaxID=151549 RepID=A0A4C1Y292_EUMVA|nr:hypothetical protein EVAR_46268_1 [Eumeta japonica]
MRKEGVGPRAYTPAAFPNTLPSGFRPTASLAELAGYTRPQHQEQQDESYNQQAAKLQQQQQVQQEVEEDLEEEKEEPDRLSALLQQSKFDCVGKQTGYYADEELACEVFHYCQDSVKHSWICPDGFTFHQVHLICMPPTHDSICQKSSKYHFVNEYLYRPVNEEEVQRKPNVALKYSDRFYPADIYRDDRFEDEEQEEDEQPRRQQQQVQQQQQQQQLQQAPRPSPRPQQQVFRTAEEVNIPLVQRRPQRPYEFDF